METRTRVVNENPSGRDMMNVLVVGFAVVEQLAWASEVGMDLGDPRHAVVDLDVVAFVHFADFDKVVDIHRKERVIVRHTLDVRAVGECDAENDGVGVRLVSKHARDDIARTVLDGWAR